MQYILICLDLHSKTSEICVNNEWRTSARSLLALSAACADHIYIYTQTHTLFIFSHKPLVSYLKPSTCTYSYDSL